MKLRRLLSMERLFHKLSLSSKSLVLSIVMGLLLWAMLDHYQSRQLQALLGKEIHVKLNNELASLRMRFHRYLGLHTSYITQLAHNPDFNRHFLRRLEQGKRTAPVMIYQRNPDSWGGYREFWNAPMRADYLVTLDADGQPQEIVNFSTGEVPSWVLNPDPLVVELALDDIYLAQQQEGAYLFTSTELANGAGRIFYIKSINDELLGSALGDISMEDRIAAIFDGNREIIATTNPLIRRSKDLLGDYIAGKSDFFDYGASELKMSLGLLIPKTIYAELTANIIRLERNNRLISFFVITFTLFLLTQVYANRLQVFVARVRNYALQVFGAEGTFEPGGDELNNLQQAFEQFTSQMVSAQELERHQHELEKQSLQRDLLEGLTREINIGLVIREENRSAYPVNDVMRKFLELCPDLSIDTEQINHREEKTFFDKNGDKCIFSFNVISMANNQAVLVQNVSDQRLYTERLEHIARHDALTGLINRYAFEQHFKVLALEETSSEPEHVLAYIDLDAFKIVNDTCGHTAGDELLKQVTGILRKKLRKSDIIARLGGDEFGVIFQFCDRDSAQTLIQKLIDAIISYRFVWDEKVFSIGMSVGMASFGAKDEIDALLPIVDAACYLAKRNGGKQYHFYDTGDVDLHAHRDEMDWVSGILKGLSENRFILYQQKIAAISEKTTAEHYEILIRYQDESGDIIPPGAFLSAAERYNQIENIDRFVVSKVLEWMQDNPDSNAVYSINLSGKSLGSENFQSFLVETIQSSSVDPGRLCFEITETAIIKNVQNSIQFIRLVKSLGARFSLDDFGSGLSSYAYLRQFPVDYLKIDGVFVKNIIESLEDYVFVRSMTEVGHCLGMKVIAEFVEDKKMFHLLREARVDYAQGWGVAKPEPLQNHRK